MASARSVRLRSTSRCLPGQPCLLKQVMTASSFKPWLLSLAKLRHKQCQLLVLKRLNAGNLLTEVSSNISFSNRPTVSRDAFHIYDANYAIQADRITATCQL